MVTELTLFTIKDCKDCLAVNEFLTERKIPFEECNMDDAKKEIEEATGYSFPILMHLVYDRGWRIYVPVYVSGFEAIKKYMGSKRNFKEKLL